ncbi:MAG: YggS family pyridoxal phosphate-dependent enzyme [Bacteroidales bacterium]
MIAENLKKIHAQIPTNVCLIAVSKTKPIALLEEAYSAGQRVFGENKAQEMRDKQEVLPKDIVWHFIGHLQTNKIKYIAPFVHLIHSVDSLELLQAIDKEAFKNGRVIDCLLQLHIAKEETKFGLNQTETTDLLTSDTYKNLHNIRIVGLRGRATNTPDTEQIQNEFIELHNLFLQLKNGYFKTDPAFKEISMGMSEDYNLAIAHGSTMVRVGSAIFGARVYTK